MARREETTELVQVWQEAREAGDDPVRALMQVLLQGLLKGVRVRATMLSCRIWTILSQTSSRCRNLRSYPAYDLRRTVGSMSLILCARAPADGNR